jgi:hypothetical protein
MHGRLNVLSGGCWRSTPNSMSEGTGRRGFGGLTIHRFWSQSILYLRYGGSLEGNAFCPSDDHGPAQGHLRCHSRRGLLLTFKLTTWVPAPVPSTLILWILTICIGQLQNQILTICTGQCQNPILTIVHRPTGRGLGASCEGQGSIWILTIVQRQNPYDPKTPACHSDQIGSDDCR